MAPSLAAVEQHVDNTYPIDFAFSIHSKLSFLPDSQAGKCGDSPSNPSVDI